MFAQSRAGHGEHRDAGHANPQSPIGNPQLLHFIHSNATV